MSVTLLKQGVRKGAIGFWPALAQTVHLGFPVYKIRIILLCLVESIYPSFWTLLCKSAESSCGFGGPWLSFPDSEFERVEGTEERQRQVEIASSLGSGDHLAVSCCPAWGSRKWDDVDTCVCCWCSYTGKHKEDGKFAVKLLVGSS